MITHCVGDSQLSSFARLTVLILTCCPVCVCVCVCMYVCADTDLG